ncbi:hypothetical protein O1M63_07810 [Streptomyces mirabilis]|nr:hypothetical protein [Streptomyces mirabilis]
MSGQRQRGPGARPVVDGHGTGLGRGLRGVADVSSRPSVGGSLGDALGSSAVPCGDGGPLTGRVEALAVPAIDSDPGSAEAESVRHRCASEPSGP